MKRKSNRLIWVITLMSVLAILLSGCSLAKEDAGSDSKDTLIGMFITDEYLDLFDIDAWANDNAFTLSNNTDIEVNNSGKYINPLYADIDRHGSDDPSDWDISFKGTEGHYLLSPVWTDENGAIGHTSKVSDGLCDVKTDVSQGDDGDKTTLSATIYMVAGALDNDMAYHTNPVYQTADGKIYTIPGSGFSTSSQTGEGETMSSTISDQFDSVENMRTKTTKTSVTIHHAVMYEPVKITLIQMDGEHHILKQEEYTPGKLPEKLEAEKDTAYFIVETEKKTPDGSSIYARNIYEQKESDNGHDLETYYAMDNMIVTKQSTEIIWQ